TVSEAFQKWQNQESERRALFIRHPCQEARRDLIISRPSPSEAVMHRYPGNALNFAHAPQCPRFRTQSTAFKTRLIACFLLLAACLSAPSWARDTAPLTASAELETLNGDFRALYRERTQQVLEALPLVLV